LGGTLLNVGYGPKHVMLKVVYGPDPGVFFVLWVHWVDPNLSVRTLARGFPKIYIVAHVRGIVLFWTV
jgi:hypothetical protein